MNVKQKQYPDNGKQRVNGSIVLRWAKENRHWLKRAKRFGKQVAA